MPIFYRLILLTISLSFFTYTTARGASKVNTNTLTSVVIVGPTTSVVGGTQTFTVSFRNSSGQSITPPAGDYEWLVSGGTVNSSNMNSISITWNSIGNRTLSYEFILLAGTYFDNHIVNVTSATVDVPNTTFTLTQNCNETVVVRNTNPPAGITWFWQTSATGTTTSLGSSSSIPRQTSGSLFLRARNASNVWSTSSQSVGTISIVSPPSVPASSTNGDVISATGGFVTLSVSSVSGATSYRWYATSTGGSSISGVSSTTYSPFVTNTATFYVEAVNGNCPSTTRRAVTANVHPLPVISGPDNIVMGQEIILSASSQYDLYQWRLNNLDIVGATQPTYQTKIAGTYSVSVKKGNSSQVVSNEKLIVIGPYGQNKNFIVSNSILKDGIVSEEEIDQLSVEHNNQVIKYFDGLGRPIQVVTTQGSQNKFDIVQPMSYDGVGRENRKYLFYVSSSNSGLYKEGIIDISNGNPAGEFLNFYTSPPIGVPSDSRPFSETVFEASPLNRPLKDYGVGASWFSNDKPIQHGYFTNVFGTGSGQERIIAWAIDVNGQLIRSSPVSNYIETGGYYSTGQLLVRVTVDEQGNTVREYADKEGRTVLKKVQIVAGQANVNIDSDWAMTYYVYDVYGNLSVVLPPEAVKAITSN